MVRRSAPTGACAERRIDPRPGSTPTASSTVRGRQPQQHHCHRGNFAMSKKVILITGASSGFGRLTAEALARAGHTVYASMREVAGRNARNAAELAETSKRDGVDLRAIELDVQSETSVNAAVEKVIGESGRIDVVVYNAGHMIGLRRSPYLGENYDG